MGRSSLEKFNKSLEHDDIEVVKLLDNFEAALKGVNDTQDGGFRFWEDVLEQVNQDDIQSLAVDILRDIGKMLPPPKDATFNKVLELANRTTRDAGLTSSSKSLLSSSLTVASCKEDWSGFALLPVLEEGMPEEEEEEKGTKQTQTPTSPRAPSSLLAVAEEILKDTDSIPKDSDDVDRLIWEELELDVIYQRLECRPDTANHVHGERLPAMDVGPAPHNFSPETSEASLLPNVPFHHP